MTSVNSSLFSQLELLSPPAALLPRPHTVHSSSHSTGSPSLPHFSFYSVSPLFVLFLLIYLFSSWVFFVCVRNPSRSNQPSSFVSLHFASLHPSTSPPLIFPPSSGWSHLEAAWPQLELKHFWSTSSCRMPNKGRRYRSSRQWEEVKTKTIIHSAWRRRRWERLGWGIRW